eukprot:scaffold232674_cov36-Cyclotella_meneghiniana.AAC.1
MQNHNIDKFELLVLEFVIERQHKHSDYKFTWFIPYGKPKFERGRLWAVARKLIDEASPGYLRIKYILQQDGKLDATDANNVAITKYSVEDDILRQVLAVMAAVASKIPLSVFKNVYFRNYTQSLDPKHNPPDHLKITRIIEVLIDAGVVEFVKICNERRKLLRHGKVVTLGYGPVREFGANLPEGRNYKEYLDEKGRFNNLKFFIDYKDKFPTLNLIVQREASRRVVEVGCE